MSYFLGRVYLGGLLTSDAPDPITPADGIQNFVGALDITGDVTLARSKKAQWVDANEGIWSDADNRLQLLAGGAEIVELASDAELAINPQATFGLTLTQAKTNASSTPAELLTLVGAAHGDATEIAASTEASDVFLNLARTVTWETGALATQRAVVIGAPDYAFAGASTITDAITLDVTEPTAGTNATITNAYAARFNGNVKLGIDNWLVLDDDGNSAIYADSDDLIRHRVGGATRMSVTGSLLAATVQTTITPSAKTSGTLTALTVTGAAHTSLTNADNPDVSLDLSADLEIDGSGAGPLALMTGAHVKARTYKAVAGDPYVITLASTVYIDQEPQAGANITLTTSRALHAASGEIYAQAGFVTDTGYAVEGVSTSRCVIRAARLRITGIADTDTVTLEHFDEWNGEALATETVDINTPTGGTRFDIAADGDTITIKGLSQVVLDSISHHIHSNDNASDWNVHVGVASGDPIVTATNPTTGAVIDFSDIGAGKIIDIDYTYITST